MSAIAFRNRPLNIPVRACRAALMIVVGAAMVAAQAGPDFSGRWVLEDSSLAKADVARSLLVRQSLVSTNVRGEPMTPFFKELLVERAFEGGTRSETYQLGLAGGVVPGIRRDGSATGSHLRNAARLEERQLVIETGSFTGPTPETGEWTERLEVWALDSVGRLRVVITTRSSAAPSTAVALVYKRQ